MPVLRQRERRPDRAFERLYRAHVHEVYRYALAVTGNRTDAEDVVQNAFMNAYRALDRGERPEKPRNWLIAITHNVCRERFRQAARRPTEVLFDDDVAETLVPSDDTPSAADIQRALGQLALNQREALVMRELEGRSYAEIAGVLGLTVSAVETLLFRARRALREQLEGSLTCSQAEAALSLQLDGRLPRAEAGPLRAHLRACETCNHLARRQRAQRKGLRALAAVPLPASLAHWGGGGAAGAGAAGAAGTAGGAAAGGAAAGGGALLSAGVALKAAAVVAGVAVAGGGGYAVVRHEATSTPPRGPAVTTVEAARTATTAPRPPGAHAKPKAHARPQASPPSAAAASKASRPADAPAAAAPGQATTPAAAPSQSTAGDRPGRATTKPAHAKTTPVHAKKKPKRAHAHAKPATPKSCRTPGREHARPCVGGRPANAGAGKP